MDLTQEIIGAWTLVDYQYPINGVDTKPLGDHPTGFLMYTPDGYVAANMMTSDIRPKYASADLHKGTLAEMAAAAEGYVAYAGRFEIKSYDETAQKLVVRHHMTVSMNPTWLGEVQERYVTYDPAAQTITITAAVNDARLVWRKQQ